MDDRGCLQVGWMILDGGWEDGRMVHGGCKGGNCGVGYVGGMMPSWMMLCGTCCMDDCLWTTDYMRLEGSICVLCWKMLV